MKLLYLFFFMPSLVWGDNAAPGFVPMLPDFMGETEHFLKVLEAEPENPQAHQRIALIIQELETQQHARTEKERLQILKESTHILGAREKFTRALKQAFQQAMYKPMSVKKERLKNRCEEARLEKDLGHFLAAEDLLLDVLEEDRSYAQAQRDLSDLQAEVRMLLDHGLSVSTMERYALEGFYAYGQADYAAAAAAWDKARQLLNQMEPSGRQSLGSLHFEKHEKIARAHVEEEKQVRAVANTFSRGVENLRAGRPLEALSLFRQVAIANPEYPHLAEYLLQAEADAERDRTRRLSLSKKQEADRWFREGLDALERGKSALAEKDFDETLKLDPGNPQAESYIKVARAELDRQEDPKASQAHYEAGLVAYASGKLDEASREWRIASRLDSHNEKAARALVKVEKEISLFKNPQTP